MTTDIAVTATRAEVLSLPDCPACDRGRVVTVLYVLVAVFLAVVGMAGMALLIVAAQADARQQRLRTRAQVESMKGPAA